MTEEQKKFLDEFWNGKGTFDDMERWAHQFNIYGFYELTMALLDAQIAKDAHIAKCAGGFAAYHKILNL